MLQGEFFNIISSEWLPAGAARTGVETISVRAELDPGHPIYGGHFPGNPVVPGVCQVQMVKEALETVKKVRGLLVAGDNIKFLKLIVPAEHPVLTIDFTVKPQEEEKIGFSAVISDETAVFMKFKGTLCIRPY
jgi:3-hydroxyacyl-[acyl-carrier-protein] dehydratase